jgi:hypothetical protein
MWNIDKFLDSLHTLSDDARARWAENAEHVIAKGPHPRTMGANPKAGRAQPDPHYENALRVRDAIAALDAQRPADSELLRVAGLDWERSTAGRKRYRGFKEDRFVARVVRRAPGKFVVEVLGTVLPKTCRTLSEAREAAADALDKAVQPT